MIDLEIKAIQDILLDLPQERITGDVLRGRGPRRGNLERLLRYWRPIMRKPGGFTRCRVILKNHPELYPLSRICAWLHHETTGLWPNEGCHHPTMKNCKGKLKKLKNWSDGDFNRRMKKRFKKGKKSLEGYWEDSDDVFFSDFQEMKSLGFDDGIPPVVTEMDYKHAFSVLTDFVAMEPTFANYLRDYDNWELEVEMSDGTKLVNEFTRDDDCRECA